MVEPILDETVDVIVPFQRVEHKLGTFKIISGFDEERSKFKMNFFEFPEYQNTSGCNSYALTK